MKKLLTQVPISYIDIRFCVHATEDVNKVIEAVENILPEDQIENIKFEKNVVEGHYGNPIIFFNTRIKDKEIVNSLVKKLSSNLKLCDKKNLSANKHLCIDKGNLYVRLDKQAALKKEIKVVISDPIRIRIRFMKTKFDDLVKVCREIGMLT